MEKYLNLKITQLKILTVHTDFTWTPNHDSKSSRNRDFSLVEILEIFEKSDCRISNVSKKEALLLKLECGVNIRLIVDSEYMFVTGSKVPILAQAGVKVIHDHTTGLFHHKFAIIDHKILITGSLNWTRQEW